GGAPVKRVLVPLAPGFEEIEAVTIIDVLRRPGITVEVAGTEPGPITGSHGITVTPDRPLAGADAGAYDLVALPGGMPGTLHLREHFHVRRIVRELASRGRYTSGLRASARLPWRSSRSSAPERSLSSRPTSCGARRRTPSTSTPTSWPSTATRSSSTSTPSTSTPRRRS